MKKLLKSSIVIVLLVATVSSSTAYASAADDWKKNITFTVDLYKDLSKEDYVGALVTIIEFIASFFSQPDTRIQQILDLCIQINAKLSDYERISVMSPLGADIDIYPYYLKTINPNNTDSWLLFNKFMEDQNNAAGFIMQTYISNKSKEDMNAMRDAYMVIPQYLTAVVQFLPFARLMNNEENAQSQLRQAVQVIKYALGYCDTTTCYEGIISQAEFYQKVMNKKCSRGDSKCELKTYNEAKTRDGSFWKAAMDVAQQIYSVCTSCTDLNRGTSISGLDLVPNQPINYYFELSNYGSFNPDPITGRSYNILIDLDLKGPEDWVLIGGNDVSIPYRIPLTKTGIKIYNPNGALVTSKICLYQKGSSYYLVDGSGMTFNCRGIIYPPMSGKYRLEINTDRSFYDVALKFSESGGIIANGVPVEVTRGNYCNYFSCPVGLETGWVSTYALYTGSEGAWSVCNTSTGCNLTVTVKGGYGNEYVGVGVQTKRSIVCPTVSPAVAATQGRSCTFNKVWDGVYSNNKLFYIEVQGYGEVPKMTLTATLTPR
jgi:hypothetical protein